MANKEKEPEKAPEPGDPGPAVAASKIPDAPAAEGKPEKGRTIRITTGGARDKYTFRGKKFTRQGIHVKPDTLKWKPEDWAAAEADPNLTIEHFEDGKLVRASASTEEEEE